jgi:hypothetical protein
LRDALFKGQLPGESAKIASLCLVHGSIGLEFKIAEVRASLNVLARIVRKEGNERIGIALIGLALEDLNAIQLYVMGRLKDLTPPRDLSGIGMHRLFSP